MIEQGTWLFGLSRFGRGISVHKELMKFINPAQVTVKFVNPAVPNLGKRFFYLN